MSLSIIIKINYISITFFCEKVHIPKISYSIWIKINLKIFSSQISIIFISQFNLFF